MATLVGHIGPFVEGQEEWPQYAERVEHFFKANGIDGDEKRLTAFLSLIGPVTKYLVPRAKWSPRTVNFRHIRSPLAMDGPP